ncbi:MAG TPA: type III ribulose-bisphosphate carboxylase [bacterium]|jgi:ribulose-bisphosphate carboxylase large chain|nr:type III ribulose-bisphosphate carboxylase [bacterium]HOG38001.1 type III ribulose-bisphosphate carboxylase [bacterium]
MNKKSYINLNYKPDKDDIIATYRIESKLGLEKAAIEVAAESSIGTWTKLSTLTQKTFNKLASQIFFIDKKKKIVKIAYPIELFELGSIPQLLSALAGNIFSMKTIDNLRLEDLSLSTKYINSFQGPYYGINGVRKLMNIKNRPLIGSIIKPKVGLNVRQHAKLAYDVWVNGVDVVKDDENLTDLPFNKFKDRVVEVMKLKKKAELKTGHKKIHVFNITSPMDKMLSRAKFVKKMGGKCVMVDLVSVGLDNVQVLRRANLGLIIHGHRAGHSMFTRNPRHGLSMLVIAKLARLSGIDQLHTGTVVGKMDGSREEVIKINESIKEDFGINRVLRENWGKIKPVLPIASGGLHPGLTKKLIDILGCDLIINYGGGIHGHPNGSISGARACYQSIELALNKKIKLDKEKFKEYYESIEYWKNGK